MSVKEGYVYIGLDPRVRTRVKIGRTNSPRRRIIEYRRISPKMEFICVAGPYDDCHEVERLMILLFSKQFGCPSTGREYFTAPIDEAISVFTKFCYDSVGQELKCPVPMETDSCETWWET
jgi:hypothetical protein